MKTSPELESVVGNTTITTRRSGAARTSGDELDVLHGGLEVLHRGIVAYGDHKGLFQTLNEDLHPGMLGSLQTPTLAERDPMPKKGVAGVGKFPHSRLQRFYLIRLFQCGSRSL